MKKGGSLLIVLLLLVTSALGAKEQIFTDHFQIIFDETDKESAWQVASFADEVYGEIASLLDHYPQKKIPVILIANSATSNGYYSPFPPRIALYVNSPADRFLGSRTPSWLRSLFTHELTHYIHLTAPVGLGGALMGVFGPDAAVINSALMPGYWIEGITTYAEKARGNFSHFALSWRSPLVTNSMWSINQGAYNSAYSPSGRIYATGYLMVKHIYETYGEEAYAAINRHYTAWPFFGLSFTFRQVLGKSAKALFAEALTKEDTLLYHDFVWPPIISPAEAGNYYLPYQTEQGLYGYANNLDKGGFIYHLEDDNFTIEAILPISNGPHVAFSGDGKLLYFTHYWTKKGTESYSDLYRYTLESKKLERLTTQERFYQSATNYDGSRLVATDRKHNLLDITAGFTLLAKEAYQPQFSPDGEMIAYIQVEKGLSTIVTLTALGKKELFPPGPLELHNLRFNGNSELLFSQNLELYRINLTTGELVHLWKDPIGVTGALRVAKELYYSTYTDNGWALRKLSTDKLEESIAVFPTAEVFPKEEKFPQLETQKYSDTPRFNFWLPSLSDELAPGATFLLRSPLQHHTIMLSAGYSLQKTSFTALALYQLSLDNFSLGIEASFGQKQSLATVMALPLYSHYSPKGLGRLSSLLALSGVLEDKVAQASYQLSYAYGSYGAPKDLYGRWAFALKGAFLTRYYGESNALLFFTIAAISGQIPLGRTHQSLELKLEGALVHNPEVSIVALLPDYLAVQRKAGQVKALTTIRYRLPLGLFDYPIPYGGLTALGLTLSAQSALYLNNGLFDWEEDLYLSLKLDSSIAIGTSVLNPTVALAFSVREFKPAFHFSLNLDLPLARETLASRF
ncbi:MAG: hypothetical protein WCY78_05060 [Sphaerochaetaceae bacterium]